MATIIYVTDGKDLKFIAKGRSKKAPFGKKLTRNPAQAARLQAPDARGLYKLLLDHVATRKGYLVAALRVA